MRPALIKRANGVSQAFIVVQMAEEIRVLRPAGLRYLEGNDLGNDLSSSAKT